jgi:hypothetical protein
LGALTTAARSTGITDPHALGPVIEHALESTVDHVIWMRVLDPESNVVAQGGAPQGTAKAPPQWWERVEKYKSLGGSPSFQTFGSVYGLRYSFVK